MSSSIVATAMVLQPTRDRNLLMYDKGRYNNPATQEDEPLVEH